MRGEGGKNPRSPCERPMSCWADMGLSHPAQHVPGASGSNQPPPSGSAPAVSSQGLMRPPGRASLLLPLDLFLLPPPLQHTSPYPPQVHSSSSSSLK